MSHATVSRYGVLPQQTADRPGIPCQSCGSEVAQPPGYFASPSSTATCSSCVIQHLPRTRRIRRAFRPLHGSLPPLRKAA